MNVSKSRRVHSLIALVDAEISGVDAPARRRNDGVGRADEEDFSLHSLDCFWVGCSDYPASSAAVFPAVDQHLFKTKNVIRWKGSLCSPTAVHFTKKLQKISTGQTRLLKKRKMIEVVSESELEIF